jgi:hypothetical protein
MIFRSSLARRLIQIVTLSAPFAGVPATTGCLRTGCGDPIGDPHQVCVDPSQVPTADGGIDPSTCPTGTDALTAIYSLPDQFNRVEIERGPTRERSSCCYVVQEIADCTGRPFLVDEQPLCALAVAGAGWSEGGEPSPRVDDLSGETRASLAEAWTRDGLLEHASIASFGRFALELLAAGAPADLVSAAHQAALDEVRHARLCFSLARAYAGAPLAPGGFPFGGHVEVSSDLADIAARAAREGAIGETIAAVQAEEQRARATDPAVRAALAIIAADEARHAELAWRTVVWALRTGGPRVHAAVAEALAIVESACADGARGEGALEVHGRLDPEERRRVAGRAIVEVIRPAARVLLGREALLKGRCASARAADPAASA